jgi:hypothetical protein
MKRMAASNVLIVGLDGLGVEIGGRTDLCCPGSLMKQIQRRT